MELLQVFIRDMQQQYDQFNNHAPADTFRATLMVTAMSHGFSTDLRTEFRDLNFPISNQIYDELLSLLSVNKAEPLMPAAFDNPFNPVTTIPVDIPFRSNITLTIYDLLGREVTTIYTGPLESGRHFFTWNGRDKNGNLASTGIYISRLSTRSGITFSTKMVLIK